MTKKSIFPFISNWNRARLARRRNAKEQARREKMRNASIVVLTPPHCLTLAKDFQRYLKDVGHHAEVSTDEVDAAGKLAIVICPQIFKKLPKKYIAVQMEQSVSSRWFTDDYFQKLQQSLAVIDYSKTNIAFLLEHELPFSKVFYTPILPDTPSPAKQESKVHDVLFYGDIHNARRKAMLDELSQHFNIKVITDSFGEDLHKDLAKAKIILNIHYYEGALLESVRLSEALRFGAVIISERAADSDSYKELDDIIDFVDVGDVNAMKDRIHYWLGDEARRRLRIQSQNNKISDIPAETKFHFLRTLLALDIIDFEKFYSATQDFIKVTPPKICLSLPESLERRAAFTQENTHGFEIFPGLRHSLGWVGCGMSFKYLLRRAHECNLQTVTICEDDAGFSDQHDTKIRSITDYLSSTEWDVFSGFIADVHESTEYSDTIEYKGINLIHMDKMVSMVFNIYNRSFFQALEPWSPDNHNRTTNTIDRFIQAKDGIKVVTTLPFLVQHKEDLHSTLWDFSNKEYSRMVNQSVERLTLAADRLNQSATPAS